MLDFDLRPERDSLQRVAEAEARIHETIEQKRRAVTEKRAQLEAQLAEATEERKVLEAARADLKQKVLDTILSVQAECDAKAWPAALAEELEDFCVSLVDNMGRIVENVLAFSKPKRDGMTGLEVLLRLRRDDVMKVYERAKRRNELAKRKRAAVYASDDPVLFTNSAPRAGWYKACVFAHVDTIDVELEVRKESDYGMQDGHVLSRDDYRRLQEDEEDSAATNKKINGRRNVQQLQWQQGEMAQDQDFEEAKAKIKELRSHLADIQSLMAKERRRVATHKEINEHSHRRMVKASFFETILFVAITLFQVYLIHTWFTSGTPVLGR